MKNRNRIILFFMFLSIQIYSQSISTSPYSIYGLGSLYESDFGPISAMGSTGIALPSSKFINNKNPASLAYIGPNSFFLDLGAKAIWSTYEDNSKSEKKQNFQFSHLAIAFPITSKSGISIALKPYSSASYIISDYKLKIGNSDEYYYLDAASKGGLNNFDIAYGYKISNKIAIGIAPSVYFGNIEENKAFTIANTLTTVKMNSYFTGVRITLGNQFKIDSTFSLGLVFKSPSQISASKTKSITSVSGTEMDVEIDAINITDQDYYLPFEFGIGFNKLFKNNMTLVLDYEKSLWKTTNQSSLYGEYTNQDKISLGFSYFNKRPKINFSDYLHYYSGINYDSGYLLINNQRINNITFSIGVGIPIERTNSLVNVSYSYGIQGKVSNDLIKENYHKIGVNLSFEAIWFVKRKYD